MVEERTTDPRRIAELLASEVTGLSTGPLADAAVVDADRDVEPTPEGDPAYRIAHGDRRVGTVELSPDAVSLSISPASPAGAGATVANPSGLVDPERDDVSVEDGETVRVTIRSGAAVKPAVDVVAAVLSARSGD